MEQLHYVCLGGCEGVSQNPGVCQATECENLNKNLVSCSCENNEHADSPSTDEEEPADE